MISIINAQRAQQGKVRHRQQQHPSISPIAHHPDLTSYLLILKDSIVYVVQIINLDYISTNNMRRNKISNHYIAKLHSTPPSPLLPPPPLLSFLSGLRRISQSSTVCILCCLCFPRCNGGYQQLLRLHRSGR